MQQLLPRDATSYANAELKKLAEFAEAHRAPDGLGWTDVYVIQKAPTELGALGIKRRQFGEIVSRFLPAFDIVYTGSGPNPYRQQCRKTAAWGTSLFCALFADWTDEGTIAHAWTAFFENDEASVLAGTRVVAALAELYPLVYVDWAWGYACDASDEDAFASLLRAKLKKIAENRNSFRKG